MMFHIANILITSNLIQYNVQSFIGNFSTVAPTDTLNFSCQQTCPGTKYTPTPLWRGPVLHHIAWRIAMIEPECRSDFDLATNTLFSSWWCGVWRVCCEYFGDKPKGTALMLWRTWLVSEFLYGLLGSVNILNGLRVQRHASSHLLHLRAHLAKTAWATEQQCDEIAT